MQEETSIKLLGISISEASLYMGGSLVTFIIFGSDGDPFSQTYSCYTDFVALHRREAEVNTKFSR